VAAVGGFAVTENAARGIVVPLRGATASLWIEWQIPLFLLLFAFWLAAAWLLRIAMGRRPMVELRSAAVIALACGAVATFIVWTKTTEQRLQLAMRDVAALQRTDAEATQLLTRFGAELSDFDSAGTRADLLKRYARSDLAAAGLQVSLGSWKGDTLQSVRIDLAELPYNDQKRRACRQTVAWSDRATGNACSAASRRWRDDSSRHSANSTCRRESIHRAAWLRSARQE
jgi:hypothetical protein